MKAEEAYRRMASIYLREYSAELRRELEVLNKEQAAPTPFLDRRVREHVARIKRTRRNKWIGALVAACLVITFTSPMIWKMTNEGRIMSGPAYEILPLSFAMPGQFAVASVEQDHEKTVYLIDNTMRDPVVMTMEQNADVSFFDTLTPVTIGEYTAYGRSDSGYQLLSFEKQGILYTLTCAYDINTLADLSRGILISKNN